MKRLVSLLSRTSGVMLCALAFAMLFAPSASAQPDSATATITDVIADTAALHPLNEWSQVFRIELSYGDEDFAPRIITLLQFELKDDPLAGDRSYDIAGALRESDIAEIAIFREGGDSDDWGELDAEDTIVLGRSGGAFAGVPLSIRPNGELVYAPGNNIDSNGAALRYNLDLREFNVEPTSDPGNSYFVAIRTSATWRSLITMAVEVTGLSMRLPNGAVPVGTDGENVDSYSPDFSEGEILDDEKAFSSSFGVWDITGGPDTSLTNPEFSNAWTHPHFLYTPPAEFARPRLDNVFGAVDFVTGEFLSLRKLMPIEQWSAVIGINLHGHPVPKAVDSQNIGTTITDPIDPFIREANIIFTDIGGDPTAGSGTPNGDGGLNPLTGLEPFTLNTIGGAGGGDFNPDLAFSRDYTFNGVQIFHDTNGNGVFDPPLPLDNPTTIAVEPGVTMAGRDYPLDSALYTPTWEYIRNPPWGGDPAWKVRLGFSSVGRRRLADQTPEGYLETTPDGSRDDFFTGFVNDFFVVIRPDSGYADVSGLQGDGTGITFGADARAFIEPRRVTGSGQTTGGIYLSTMVPQYFPLDFPPDPPDAWQNGANLQYWNRADGSFEGYWPERTLNYNNAKPFRIGGPDVHDLVLTYETNNEQARVSDIVYGRGGLIYPALGLGSSSGTPIVSNFDAWMDPSGLLRQRFLNRHTVGAIAWFTNIAGVDDHVFDPYQYPYETTPFVPFSQFEGSPFVANPPAQPGLPTYLTWPFIATGLPIGQYPRETDWTASNRAARILRQHINANSTPTAVLGINLVGADDPATNSTSRYRLLQVAVAFWGPGFDPRRDLLSLSSGGVQLVEDRGRDLNIDPEDPFPGSGTLRDGVFGFPASGVIADPTLSRRALNPFASDRVLPTQGLVWGPGPEFVDVDGDGVPDDMDGINPNGPLTDNDRAWVLRIRLTQSWELPVRDAIDQTGNTTGLPDEANFQTNSLPFEEGFNNSDGQIAATRGSDTVEALGSTEVVHHMEFADPNTDTGAASVGTRDKPAPVTLGPYGNPGDDLYIVLRASDKMRRFQQFRTFVPAFTSTSANPGVSMVKAGMELAPTSPVSTTSYVKSHPEEQPVQPFFGSAEHGFDMMEANIATAVTPLTGGSTTISKNSGPFPVLGIDASTNRPEAVVATSFTNNVNGVGAAGSFTVPGAVWTPNAFTGYYLIDREYESYRITANSANQLTLASGSPRTGGYAIVKDPTFLEQLIVEFTDKNDPFGEDPEPPGFFNIEEDLLPVGYDIPHEIAGVRLFRDNDFNPGNVNGQFDPGDILVPLDYNPFRIGQPGEPDQQVMFVFSTPGTSTDPLHPLAAQTIKNATARNRQWVYDTLGPQNGGSSREQGPDFFIVIATSDQIQVGDDFLVSLNSWGPNTPSLPDPHRYPPPPLVRFGEFDVLDEFPWGARGLGYISIVSQTANDPDRYYKNYPVPDGTPFNWVRSRVSIAAATGVIVTVPQGTNPSDLVINSVSPTTLTRFIANSGQDLVITGQNFGTAPQVTLGPTVSGTINLTVQSASNSTIQAQIPGGTELSLTQILTLRVTNPNTLKTDTFSGFTVVDANADQAPTIVSVNPSSGTSAVFPVQVIGTNFEDPRVIFGQTVMPRVSWSPTQVTVSFPVSGLPTTGLMNVTVVNTRNGQDLLSVTKANAFNYINNPGGGGGGGFLGGGGSPLGGCFIATAAYGTPFSAHLDTFRSFRDGVLLKSAAGAAFVDAYYRISPALADEVAVRPWLAGFVRGVLTPVAWSLEHPWLVLALALALASGAVGYRKRRKAGAN